jgi:hypothetical protein
MKITGVENMPVEQLKLELQRGGKFVIFSYCFSLLIMTFKRGSDVYFVKASESRVMKGLPFTLLSLLAGWWGIPWGPIYTISSIVTNLRGGRDVTSEVLDVLALAGAQSKE